MVEVTWEPTPAWLIAIARLAPFTCRLVQSSGFSRLNCFQSFWSPWISAHLFQMMAGDLEGLHDAGGADRVHAADQAAGEIGRQLAGFAGVRIGVVTVARFDIIPAVAVGPQADILVGLDVADGEGVMEFDDIEVFHRVGGCRPCRSRSRPPSWPRGSR